jgi:hypothetical protein
MNIPASRQREFHEQEVTLIKEAVLASGISISVAWFPHSVQFDGSVEIKPALFDCREVLNTSCWIVACSAKLEQAPACSCGSLVREARNGVYGSLKTAAASAIAEVVRARVLAQIPDSPETVLNARPSEQPAATCNDFITHSLHS